MWRVSYLPAAAALCENFEPYFPWSGAQTRAWHHGEEDPAVVDYIQSHFEVVEEQAFGCWRLGGRYWETELEGEAYARSLRMGTESQEETCEGCLEAHLEAIRSHLRLLPKHLVGGLCAPPGCELKEVRRRAFPAFLAHALRFDFQVPVPKPEELQINELSHWSQLKLDFVIAGLDSCGTNTLFRGLKQVEEVQFTMDDEDDFFYKHDSLLPYKAEVEDFNFRWLRGGKARLRGLRHPGLYYSHRVRLAMRQIPGLKLVLALCDPLGRFEKRFWLYHLCEVNAHHPDPVIRISGFGGRCFTSTKAALEEPWLLRPIAFAAHLAQLERLFGPEEMRAVHQAHFRERFKEVFEHLAHFLGVRGHRTDLCRNASLVVDLQRMMSAEYQTVEDLLQSHGGGFTAPQELLRRRTRCDRPEELAEEPMMVVPKGRLVAV
ncbi:Transposon Ty2-C Gag-Pol polyprotein [Durusdinium trenchii]|uniref:Transposon Ty2-C Gag-Pol polyprotein n=1 Tax=Durusdinium trenchii TaxID=1381693 RepID=A0ABP0QEI4_9DINO